MDYSILQCDWKQDAGFVSGMGVSSYHGFIEILCKTEDPVWRRENNRHDWQVGKERKPHLLSEKLSARSLPYLQLHLG